MSTNEYLDKLIKAYKALQEAEVNNILCSPLPSYKIRITNYITKQVPARHHKKKRIQKKWIKKYGYKTVQDDKNIYFINDEFLMSEAAFKKLKRWLKLKDESDKTDVVKRCQEV